MSGSHQPGATFKVKVLEVTGFTARISADEEDLAYLEPGTEYVAHFIPVAGGDDPGGDEPTP